jgi:uncharacterized protein YeaO (DUF488 family)
VSGPSSTSGRAIWRRVLICAWFNHDPERFPEFRKRYREELRAHTDQIDALRARAGRGPVTMVYAARDTKHNEAVVIAELLRAP